MRVDHPDGLRDPLQYFQRLREHAPEAWIIGEKILEPGEFLREEWPIEGTSGYDFLNVALDVLVDPEGMAELNEIYEDFTGSRRTFPPIAHDKKINVTQEALGSDVNRLTDPVCGDLRGESRPARLHAGGDAARDPRGGGLLRDLPHAMSCRTAARSPTKTATYIERAIECAKNNRPDIDAGLFDFIARRAYAEGARANRRSEFLLRFQQFTPPVMAKGVEDTAFYCYNRLIAMNEVGGDPGSRRHQRRGVPRLQREDAGDASAHDGDAFHA